MIDLERAWEIEHLPIPERRRAIRELGWHDERRYYARLLRELEAPESRWALGSSRWSQLRRLASVGSYRGLWAPEELSGQLRLPVGTRFAPSTGGAEG